MLINIFLVLIAMIDIVIPKSGSEQGFADLAKRLGLDGLIFFYTLSDSKSFQEAKNRVEGISSDLKLSVGQIVDLKTKKFFSVPKLSVTAGDSRGVMERSKANFVANLELQNKRDYLHHRASGMNHIIAKIGAKRAKTLTIFSSNLLGSGSSRLIGRIRQNLVLAKKAKLNCILVSGATNPWQMRSRSEMVALGTFLGTGLNIGVIYNSYLSLCRVFKEVSLKFFFVSPSLINMF